jgi:hypothetical protein
MEETFSLGEVIEMVPGLKEFLAEQEEVNPDTRDEPVKGANDEGSDILARMALGDSIPR